MTDIEQIVHVHPSRTVNCLRYPPTYLPFLRGKAHIVSDFRNGSLHVVLVFWRSGVLRHERTIFGIEVRSDLAKLSVPAIVE